MQKGYQLSRFEQVDLSHRVSVALAMLLPKAGAGRGCSVQRGSVATNQQALHIAEGFCRRATTELLARLLYPSAVMQCEL